MIPSARQLLGFSFDTTRFTGAAREVVEGVTIHRLELARDHLKRIVQRHQSYRPRGGDKFKNIYRLFVDHAGQGQQALGEHFNSPAMARKLAWSLCQVEQGQPWLARTEHLPLALSTINAHARASALDGLFDALLQNWTQPSAANTLRAYLGPRLRQYEGKRQVLLKAQENADYYLASSGAVRLGAGLVATGPALVRLSEHLSLPDHALKYEYFSEVAAAYAVTALRTPEYPRHIENLLEFLAVHEQSVAYKRCLAKIIIKLDNATDDGLRDRVQNMAFQRIGDPAHDHKWMAWDGATVQETEELKRAQKILGNWIARRFIIAFFDKIANLDQDRKEFWLRYTSHVTRFKVFSDHTTWYRLQSDKRLAPYIAGRFGDVNRTGGQSALMMEIKDRTIVEFSSDGAACYIYRNTNPLCPKFNARYASVAELRSSAMELLMRFSRDTYYAVEPEGRFLHIGPWQRRLSWWLLKYLGVR